MEHAGDFDAAPDGPVEEYDWANGEAADSGTPFVAAAPHRWMLRDERGCLVQFGKKAVSGFEADRPLHSDHLRVAARAGAAELREPPGPVRIPCPPGSAPSRRPGREEAAAAGDLGQAARARHEIETTTEQVAAADGLGGHRRTAGDPAERVRKAVTNRIRRALDRICAAHPDLGRHLTNALRTGFVCAYRPEHPVAWHL